MAVTITLDNLADGDSIYCPLRVTGKAVSDDGCDLSSVTLEMGIGVVTPLRNDSSPPAGPNSSPWEFHFDLDDSNTVPEVTYSLLIRAVQYGVTYFLPITFTRIN